GSRGGSAHSCSHRHARSGSVGGHVPGVPADGGRSAVPDSGPAGSGRPGSPGPDGGRAARLGGGPRPLAGRPAGGRAPSPSAPAPPPPRRTPPPLKGGHGPGANRGVSIPRMARRPFVRSGG